MNNKARQETIGSRLGFARRNMGLSVDEFSDQTSIPKSTLKKYESGSSIPGGEAIQSVSKTGINIHWLVTGEGPMMLKGSQELSQAQRAIIQSFNDYRRTVATGEPMTKAVHDFVDEYNSGGSLADQQSEIKTITYKDVRYWLKAALDETDDANHSQTETESPKVDEGLLANYKAATEHILAISPNDEAVWAALIMELTLGYGLDEKGSIRIIETLQALERRKKGGLKEN